MKILIVDDEKMIREGLKYRIEQYLKDNVQVTLANDANGALDIINSKDFDVLFCDINMPFISGLELIEKINNKDMTIIIVSGYSEFKYAQRAIELKVDNYILKPIEKTKLEEILDNLLKLYPTKSNNSIVIRIIDEINKNYHNCEYCLSLLAKDINLSESYIMKVLAKEGLSFVDMLNNKRIDKSLGLLQEQNRIKDIYQRVGFNSQSYFNVVFKKNMGISPKEYCNNSAVFLKK